MSIEELSRTVSFEDGLKSGGRISDWGSVSREVSVIMGAPKETGWHRPRPPLSGCIQEGIDFVHGDWWQRFGDGKFQPLGQGDKEGKKPNPRTQYKRITLNHYLTKSLSP